MKRILNIRPVRTDEIIWGAVLLTFVIFVWPHPSRAEDQTAMTPMHLIGDRPSNSDLAYTQRQEQINQLKDYIRQQGLMLVPGLPNAMREPTDYVAGQFARAAGRARHERYGRRVPRIDRLVLLAGIFPDAAGGRRCAGRSMAVARLSPSARHVAVQGTP